MAGAPLAGGAPAWACCCLEIRARDLDNGIDDGSVFERGESMSHVCGRVVNVGTRLGPDTAAPASGAGFWELLFTPSPALSGGDPRFVLLHFNNMALPAGSRLEVDLRYGTDTFTGASGADAWTRPIDPKPGPIRIRYFGPGPAGGATLAEYGSGEPTQTGTPGDPYGSLTDADLFLHTDPYVEPTYETRLKCGTFDWQNIACSAPGSVEQQAAKAVCCFVHVHRHPTGLVVSTCSATLIDNNLVLTAAHCATEPDDLEVRSGSVVFGYETTCPGGHPGGYAPDFFKVTKIVRRGSADWLIVEIETPPGGTGIVPAVLRSSGVVVGETVIAIHHPHGAVKKFQKGIQSTAGVWPVAGFDYAGGSSGSPLFDGTGRVVGGALSSGPLPPAYDQCHVGYTAATTILQELANPPAPPAPFDVMLVMDRSGSMAGPGLVPGRTKMNEARDAASLFVQLLRKNAGNRIGLVSFSTAAATPPDSALGNVTQGKKVQLVGANSPYTGGVVGALVPAGATSIGDGLSVATGALAPGTNQRAILLMTDGLQNTPPMIETVEGALGAIRLIAIGFGSESDLNSALLSRVASRHNGVYTRANDGLELKKFFSIAFGNIFESGALSDPELYLRRGEEETKETPFAVCEEERITAVVGWDNPSQSLEVDLRTPAGALINAATAGVESDRGETWQFLRVPLPLNGERAGAWHWRVRRDGGGGELLPPEETVRLFVTVIPLGGPRFEPLSQPERVYTGDPIRPLVALRYANGSAPHADVELEIEAPDAAVGQLIADAGLAEPEAGDDPASAFHATLKQVGGGQAYTLATRQETAELFDDGEHYDVGMEPDGIYGNLLTELTRFEGTYRFHARARLDEPCPAERETRWAIHVEFGIDQERTTVSVSDRDRGPDGRRGTVTITPRDRYGSPLGPGRGDQIPVSGTPGTATGTVVDNGDGSYSVSTTWDPEVTDEPSVVVLQPERLPVVLAPGGGTGRRARCPRWLWALLFLLALLLLIAVIVIVWLVS